MKILHSADWHLGKTLRRKGSSIIYSRLEEQKLFLDDFCEMANDPKNYADLVLVAGDIFDVKKPPIEAEQLLFDGLKKLSDNGNRLILLVAGNHDDPEKIVSSRALAKSHGIILVGTPNCVVPIGDYGKHKVVASAKGMVEVEINGENAVILTVPFPSESTLNEVLYHDMSSDKERSKLFNERIALLFKDLEKYYRDDTINIVVSHLLTVGSIEDSDQKSICLGDSSSVGVNHFPEKAQYVALGHIHKPFIVPDSNHKVRYSGSPIHYSVSEIGKGETMIQKLCYLIDVKPQEEAVIESLPIPVYKPIEVWEFDSIDAAVQECQNKKGCESYVYIKIKSDRTILADEINLIHSQLNYIVEIECKSSNVKNFYSGFDFDQIQELGIEESFKIFYRKQSGVKVSDELFNTFKSISNGENIDLSEFDFLEDIDLSNSALFEDISIEDDSVDTSIENDGVDVVNEI